MIVEMAINGINCSQPLVSVFEALAKMIGTQDGALKKLDKSPGDPLWLWFTVLEDTKEFMNIHA